MDGTIPVLTGEPSSARRRSPSRGDYPRAHGGTRATLHRPSAVDGLSPCSRGNHGIGLPVEVEPRTIPVLTGEPPGGTACPGRAWDYPRAHGGTSWQASERPPGGTIPVLTGEPPWAVPPRGVRGTIPVLTGEPRRRRGAGGPARDYPRAHGGTARRSRRRRRTDYPRAHGGTAPAVRPRLVGTIPVLTGEPVAVELAIGSNRDYPRAHGGTIGGLMGLAAKSGLSPCSRGTTGTLEILRRTGDYPRAHGGTENVSVFNRSLTGLSPCSRGNLRGGAGRADQQGTIPVLTGEP